MQPTVLIVAVLLLHGVSGHLFQQVLLHKLTKPLPKYHTRQLDADVDKFIDKRLEAAVRDRSFSSSRASSCEIDDNVDYNDTTQEEFNAVYSVFCRPECGNTILRIYESIGLFNEGGLFSREFFIGLCGTNENGDKCYESYVDTLNKTFIPQIFCYNNSECNCRSTLLEAVEEGGCCLNLYQYFHLFGEDRLTTLYDDCDVDFPSGCNNSTIRSNNSPKGSNDSPTGSGFMPQFALVTLIFALIFSVVFS